MLALWWTVFYFVVKYCIWIKVHFLCADYFKWFTSSLNQPRGELLFQRRKHCAGFIQLVEWAYGDILHTPTTLRADSLMIRTNVFLWTSEKLLHLQQRGWPVQLLLPINCYPTKQKVLKIKPDFTIFVIIGDFYFPLLWPQQGLSNLGNMMSFGLWPMKKITGARFLHDIWPGEPGHLTEPIIAVDDSTILHSSISNDEFFICNKRKWCIF